MVQPMRVSIRKHDPGYRADACTGRYSVLLDGEPVKGGVTADEELGMVERLIYDANGKPVINNINDGVVTEIVRGDVVILTKSLIRQ
jgi:hypothetical protein